MNKFNIGYLIIITFFTTIYSCQNRQDEYLFEILNPEDTGIHFSNDLVPTLELNVFNYMYFYNGGGVGTGDLNNDGLVDIVFTGNQVPNRIYLNKGEFKFEDVTEGSGFFSDIGWSTGVAINDINQDGLLDIYISQVSDFRGIQTNNLLFICDYIDENGIPHYKEESEKYGLNIKGFATQAAFFDYDLDGDLDLFLLNHSLHQNGTFGQRKSFQGTYHPLSGDKLYRNDNGFYTNVTESSGINSSVIGYGLGLAIGDLNMDGYPDIYIGNDFHENDYLYINNGDGTFSEVLTEQMMHTSRFSMGVDIADINNDLYPDVMSLDMLPYDPYILKKSEGEDALDIFRFKLGYGYNHQYAKNNLQINNGNGSFSEIAMFSDLHATDWSWSVLMRDFDNDGLKDIFVTNGIPKRMNDIDYINFMSNDEVQFRVQYDNMIEKDLELVERIPQIKLPNKLFLNKGDFIFNDIESKIKNNEAGYSNGLAFADFNNDGKIDFIANNIDSRPMLYKNTTNQNEESNNHVAIRLQGQEKNRNGIGAKILCYANDEVQLYEKFSTSGFQSSSNIDTYIGIGIAENIDSVVVIWPDFNKSTLINPEVNKLHTISHSSADGEKILIQNFLKKKKVFSMSSQSKERGIHYKHEENPFVEFNREPLIPHTTSNEGPALAVGDFNADGLEDFFVGSSKRKRAAIYIQNKNGSFDSLKLDLMRIDSIHEEVDAIAIDLNGDGYDDLVLASGGNEYYYEDVAAQSRILINDTKGGFNRIYIDSLYATAGAIEILDIDGDGKYEIVFGSRAVSWAYGEIPKSYILKITEDFKTKDVTDQFCPEFRNVGFVKGMTKTDIDGDGDLDIILALEWDGIKLLRNNGGRFDLETISDAKGWWNFCLAADFDGDGDIDILAGNLGLNNRLKASPKTPVSMYYSDFDDNGKKEQLLTYYIGGKEIPFANMMEIEKQIPSVKKKFLFAEDFAKATIEEIFGADKLKKATKLTATEFRNGFFKNNDGVFEFIPLRNELQLSTYNDAVLHDFNNDGKIDIFIAGNNFENNIQMGRYDADYGSILLNKGNFEFEKWIPEDFKLKGQVRNIREIEIQGRKFYLVAINDEDLNLIRIDNLKMEDL